MNAITLTPRCISSGKLSLISDPTEKQHALEILVRQVALNPESKLAKIKPEKIEKTTMGRIDITYLSGKKHQPTPKVNPS